MTRTAKIAIGVGVGLGTLALITYFVSEAKAAPVPGLSPPLSPDQPSQIPPTARNYVGSGWTGWPHKAVFPDADAIVQAFRRLGYDVTNDLTSAKSMAEIYQFQADHNLWWVLYGDQSLGPAIHEYPAEPTAGHLDQDRLVGTNTVEALYDALLADQHFPGGWQSLVVWYEERT